MENEKYVGVIEDPRSAYEKSFDFQHEELAMGAPVTWLEKILFKSFFIKNQDGSSSCVSQAVSKMLGIIKATEYVNLSPKFIYTRRANYPDGGMYLPNALNIGCTFGTCLETSLPSDFTGESFMNDKSQETPNCSVEALTYKGDHYFTVVNITMDAIAEVLAKGIPVLLGVRFDYDEWTETPTVNPNSKNTCGHGIAATDFGIKDGKKVISIDDSWGPHYGKGGQRFITEEFLNAKCFYAGYITPLTKQTEDTTGFHYQWSKYMIFNGRKNIKADIVALQTVLKKLGLFPVETEINGIYGPITRKAVYDFQVKYVGSNNKGIQAGPQTIAKLNEMFK